MRFSSIKAGSVACRAHRIRTRKLASRPPSPLEAVSTMGEAAGLCAEEQVATPSRPMTHGSPSRCYKPAHGGARRHGQKCCRGRGSVVPLLPRHLPSTCAKLRPAIGARSRHRGDQGGGQHIRGRRRQRGKIDHGRPPSLGSHEATVGVLPACTAGVLSSSQATVVTRPKNQPLSMLHGSGGHSDERRSRTKERYGGSGGYSSPLPEAYPSKASGSTTSGLTDIGKACNQRGCRGGGASFFRARDQPEMGNGHRQSF